MQKRTVGHAPPRVSYSGAVRILGLVFASSSTERRVEMTQFVAETLGLERIQVGGAVADMFGLPDGS